VVSANFFNLLGITPALGRTFVASDDVLGADAVLLLSHEYWLRKFGGDASVVGRVLQMNNRPHTIVGVLPAYPQYPRANDVYMPTSACPFRAKAEKDLPKGGYRSFAGLRVFGWLVPGASTAQASSEVAAIASSFAADHPKDYQRAQGLTGRVRPLEDQLVADARPMLLTLGGTTILVLLIACANVANLALARSVGRQRELAVRAALGAGRARLVRLLITESVLLAIAGGLVGLALAWLSLDLLVAFVGRFTARTGQIAIDGGVLAFTLAISVVTGIVFGAVPGLASRRDVAQSIRDGGSQAGESASRQRLRAGLVVGQVAVSFVLLVGATLLLESAHRLAAVSLGYDTDHVMTAAIFGNFSHLSTAEDVIRVHAGILERLRASPGVRAAAATSAVPLSTSIQPAQQAIHVERPGESETITREADPNVASEGYFETLSIPLLAGRDFRLSDGPDAPKVAVINAAMAKYWEGADPLGARFRQEGSEDWLTVIGVVGNFRLYRADRDVEPQFYTPLRQNGGGGGGRLLVRGDGDPTALAGTIKAAVHAVDAEMPVRDLATLAELKHGRLAAPLLTAVLLSIFAGVALLTTLTGIGGVLATSVSQRTREFGLRMALGADRAAVLRQVVGQGFVLIAIGLLCGVGGALAFSRVLARLLFATGPTDAAAYLAVAAVLGCAGLMACVGPARRATSIDPIIALRGD
jgi:predicted permease